MRFSLITLAISFSLVTPWGTNGFAQSRPAIHATSEEVSIWQTRRTSGPYQEEWTDILSRADKFVSNPGSRWAGNTTSPSSCFSGQLYNLAPKRTQDEGMRDAAFVHMLTKEAKYLDAVRQTLLAQSKVPGTNFADPKKWCPGTADFHGYGDNISPWLRRVAYAYSYVRESLPASERQAIEQWFLHAGQHHDAVVHNVVAKRFPNRLKDDYAGGCRYGCTEVLGITHAGGSKVYGFHGAWNNKASSMNAAVAVIGTLVNDGTLKSHASRYVQEWLEYGVYPGGQVHDQYRWGSGAPTQTLTPQHGYLYTGEALGSIITAVDVLARDGYANLYDYSTSAGMLGTEGGPKSLSLVMQHFAGLTTGAVKEYASAKQTSDPTLLITPSGPIQTRIEYVVLAGGNMYYQDPLVRTAYSRSLPPSWSTSGCDMRGGDWCTFPGIRFMYGELEGKVYPYPSGRDTSAKAPRNLRIVGPISN